MNIPLQKPSRGRGPCYVCDSERHRAYEFPDRADIKVLPSNIITLIISIGIHLQYACTCLKRQRFAMHVLRVIMYKCNLHLTANCHLVTALSWRCTEHPTLVVEMSEPTPFILDSQSAEDLAVNPV